MIATATLLLAAGLTLADVIPGPPSPVAERAADRAATPRPADAEREISATLVKLDFFERPLSDVIDTINKRHNLKLVLRASAPPRAANQMVVVAGDRNASSRLLELRQRKITLESDEPLTFWEAVDRLDKAAGLRYDLSAPVRVANDSGGLTLYPDVSRRGPVSDTGPFRVQVTALHAAFERDFTAGTNRDANPTGFRPASRPPGDRELVVWLAILAEPGIVVRQAGPVKVEEANDDQSRSLIPATSTGAARSWNMIETGNALLPAALRVRVDLAVPDPSGPSIDRLRGVVPVLVVRRRPDPLVIPLINDEFAGKTYTGKGTTVVVEKVSHDPNSGTTVELTTREEMAEPLPKAVSGRRPFPVSATRFAQGAHPIELRDATGQVVSYVIAQQSQQATPNGRSTRLRLNVQADGLGLGRRPIPVELRYFSELQTPAEIRFDFHDVPMP